MRLCTLIDIADGQAKGFCLDEGSDRLDVLVARRGNDVFAYVNGCPNAARRSTGGRIIS